MINAAIIGIGRWGQILVGAVQGKSDKIRFTAGVTRTPSRAAAFCAENDIALGDDYGAVLADDDVDAVVLATPHTQHAAQIVAAAKAGKHVFTEKPFTLDKASAERAAAACREAGELGTLLHAEANFSANMASMAATWRDSRAESPAGGMTSLGIHALDCMIHLCGRIAEVDARSRRRALPFDIDDTTCMLFDFDNGMTGYLGTMAAGGRLWHMRVFGTDGWAELRGMDTLVKTPAGGSQEVIEYAPETSIRAELEAFAAAASGGPAYMITPDQMVHGTAVLEAVIASAESGARVKVV